MNSYVEFIENLNDWKKPLQMSGEESLETRLVSQMKNVWHMKEELNDKQVKEFENLITTDIERSRFLELQMMASLNKGVDLSKHEEIAQKALSLNSECAFSRMILSRISFNRNNIGYGIDYLLEIEENFRGARWIYLEMARMLLFSGFSKVPSNYLRKIPVFDLRILYFLALKIFLPFYWLILASYTLWISFLDAYFPFFTILAPFIGVFAYAVLRGEKILYSWYGTWMFWLLVSTGLVVYILS